MKCLGIQNNNRAAVFSFTMGGFGVLHCAACQGHLEVCKYLVEELGGDPNMVGGEGPLKGTPTPNLWVGLAPRNMRYLNCCAPTLYIAGATPFMTSAQSGDISTVKYLFDKGGDLMKADAQGRNVLHYAVCAGCSPTTETHLCLWIPPVS
jgi:ankyrin repeat protein